MDKQINTLIDRIRKVNIINEFDWRPLTAAGLMAASTATGAIDPAYASSIHTPVKQHQASQTLGEKNHNPLNLKATYKWDGMTGKDRFGHAIFKDLEHGIRAGIKTLSVHFKKHPDETLVHYMTTFAEENGQAEARYIASHLGISTNTQLKDINLVDMMVALSAIESGTTLDRDDVVKIKAKFGI